MPRSVRLAGGLITLTLPDLKGTRDARGRFTSAQQAQRSRNRDFALALQADVVRRTEEGIDPRRRSASTGRLLKVTADPQNAEYDTWSVGVGNVTFLDRSIAKYWRTFEEGSAIWRHPFTGTQLMPKGNPPFPVAHGANPGIRTTNSTLPWMNGERWVVKHEIAPRHAYLDAIREANPSQFALQSAQKLIDDVMGR